MLSKRDGCFFCTSQTKQISHTNKYLLRSRKTNKAENAPAMQHTEFGIDPDLKVDITAADWQRGVDTILETAIDHLKLKP